MKYQITRSSRPSSLRVALLGLALGAVFAFAGPAMAAAPSTSSAPSIPAAAQTSAAPASGDRDIAQWLMRLQDASSQRAYIGTFVVMSSTGTMASAKIWHVCSGDQQMERVESLTGVQRSTFRRNDQVITFMPETKVARSEKRDTLGLFPNLLRTADSSIGEHYAARQIGSERVAGFDADVVQLRPKDNLRYGYRIWSEKQSGLVIKLQTLGVEGQVLEQAAFSDLQLDAPVKMEKLAQMMDNTEGYRVEKQTLAKTDPAAEGWTMKKPVAGFQSMNCYKRPVQMPGQAGTLQWIFSDGLASVSLFLEPYDKQRHTQEVLLSMGATQTLTKRIDEWWLTVVGEVPPQTLKAFAQNLERVK